MHFEKLDFMALLSSSSFIISDSCLFSCQLHEQFDLKTCKHKIHNISFYEYVRNLFKFIGNERF